MIQARQSKSLYIQVLIAIALLFGVAMVWIMLKSD